MSERNRFFVRAGWVTLTTLLLVSCARTTTSTPTAGSGVGAVTQITVVTTVEATGSIAPRQVASIAWDSSGTVAAVNVQIGQAVQSGDILISLDPASAPDSLITAQLNLAEMTSPSGIAAAQQAVAQAESDLTNAQIALNNLTYRNQSAIDNAYATVVLTNRNLDRAKQDYNAVESLSHDNPRWATAYQNLYSAQQAANRAIYIYNSYSGTPTQQKIDAGNANLAMAEATLQEARDYLAALTGGQVSAGATGASLLKLRQARLAADALNLRAPFAGMVGALYDEQGVVVTAGAPGAVVVDRSKLYVTVQVDESKLVLLSVGDKAAVVIEALPDLKLTGQVVAIDPIGTATQGVVYYDVQVKLDQSNNQVPLDATADVTIQAGEARQALAVPVEAIQSDSSGEYVYVVAAGGTTKRVDVVSGQIQADNTVVVQGDLTVGDQVMLVQSNSTTSTTGNGGGGGFFPGP